MRKLIILAALTLTLSACSNWEQTTYQALATAQTTLNNAQTAYEVSATLPNGACPAVPTVACIPHTKAAYTSISDAKAIWKTAADAMIVYETAKAMNAGPTALAQAQAGVEAALANLGTILKDVQALMALGGK
jgi:hypothetical protein